MLAVVSSCSNQSRLVQTCPNLFFLYLKANFIFPVNGEVGSDDSDDELNLEDANLSIVGSSGTQNGSSGRRRHHKIAMAYNAWKRIIHNFASKTKAVKYIKWNKTKKILSVFSYPNCGLKMDPLTVARKHNKIPMASNAQKRLKQKILSAKLKNFASKVVFSW